MALKIYNSFSQKKEDFTPLIPGKVGIYVCGITAYDRCHIGHARSAVVFDAVVRYLRFLGYEVTFVRNFTDIDDKIIKRANQEGISCKELSEREIKHFYEDMDALGVLRADIEPKATEHITEIIELVQKLIDKGYAYVAEGDVLFSVRSFKSYGALSKRDIEQLRAGARIAVDKKKKDPMDFTLWKASKPGEPSWESPWGPGRPGWHIECSAMSMKYLGETLDIHGGGLDLIFPHHENERAQSEAATGKEFVRFWMHNGFVTIKGDKMSKSLGNFITIKDLLKEYTPEALRLFLLSKHYRSPLDFSKEALSEAESAIMRLYTSVATAQELTNKKIKKQRPISDEAKKADTLLEGLKDKFLAAMDDDFNTAQALGYLFEGVKALNKVIDSYKKKPSCLYLPIFEKGIKNITNLSNILGLLEKDPNEFIYERNIALLSQQGMNLEELEKAIEKRNMARSQKNWEKADQIRDELLQKGIILEDSPEGTKWRIEIKKN